MFAQFGVRIGRVVTVIFEEMTFFTKAVAVLLAFLTPLHSVVGFMMFFLLADTLSAIYLRYRTVKHRIDCDDSGVKGRLQCMNLFWRVVDRDKFGKTIEKVFAYPAVALVCFVFDVAVMGIHPGEDGLIMQFSWTGLCFVLICFMDFKSFLRNMGKATGNHAYSFIEKALDRKIKDRFAAEKRKR